MVYPERSMANDGRLVGKEGLLRASDCDDERSFAKDAVDYDVVIPFKRKLFEKAGSTFNAMPRSALPLDYDQFCVEQAHWLEDFDQKWEHPLLRFASSTES